MGTDPTTKVQNPFEIYAKPFKSFFYIGVGVPCVHINCEFLLVLQQRRVFVDPTTVIKIQTSGLYCPMDTSRVAPHSCIALPCLHIVLYIIYTLVLFLTDAWPTYL